MASMRRPVIDVTTPAGTRRLMLTGDPVTIGRDRTNSLAFPDERLSRVHCVIQREGDGFAIRDLGSTNGTRLNGRLVREQALRSGDVIEVGPALIRFQLLDIGTPQLDAAEARARAQAAAVDAGAEQEASGQGPAPQPQPSPGKAAAAQPVHRRPPDPRPRGETPPRRRDRPAPTRDESARITEGDVLTAARAHDAALQEALAVFTTERPATASVGLINTRGALEHGPEGEPLETAVGNGHEGVHFLRALLLLCMHARATDLHVEPRQRDHQIRMRVDGMMVNVLAMHQEIASRILRVIKVLCDIDIAQTGAVQEGHFCLQCPERRIDYRVSFTPAMFGQKLVLRVLDLAHAPTHLRDLGLAPWMRNDIATVIRQDSGMVLMCGPTGSGKTTTLYALVREIDVTQRNIVTIEDPVEYEIEGVTQLPINESQGRSFSNLLRSVLRQDPDVILVGEIRDPETASIAMRAAITGHLVLSTVHAQDAIGTIFRLLDLKVEPYLIASGLNLVLAQRLVRRLCPHCKRAGRLTPGQMMQLARSGVADVHEAAWPVGCRRCFDTGFIGRMGVYELLTATDDLRDVIQESTQIQDMRKAIRATMFASLKQSGYQLVAESLTTIEEIDRVVGAG